jgi:hypothetical protein
MSPVHRWRLLTLIQLLDCLAESLLPKRPFFFGGIHHCLSLIVANGQVCAVFDE